MSELRERLFLALWPDEAVRAGLLQAQRLAHEQCGGRPMRADNLHLTLHFLGPCTSEQRACVERMAARVTAAPFSLQLDRLGQWPQPRIAWCGPHETPPELARLVDELAEGLPECGLAPERRPYRPHVTLLRKAAEPRGAWPELAPLGWRAERLVLARSTPAEGGTRYEVVAEWPLLG